VEEPAHRVFVHIRNGLAGKGQEGPGRPRVGRVRMGSAWHA
jgi:hypothetical protein